MEIYEKVLEFKKKYPMTIAWRLKQNCKVIEKHINPGEKVIYAFAGQKNDKIYDIISTNIIVLTDKRILIGTKRVLFGYFFTTITPDMFNDLTIHSGLFWGKIVIDTIKEIVVISNIQKSALDEIETNISEYMIAEKKKYNINYQK